MKKRIVILILGMLISGSVMTACGKKNEATKASAESEETEKEGTGENVEQSGEEEEEKEDPEALKPLIAVFLPGNAEDRRWKRDADVFFSDLRDKGYQVRIHYAGESSEAQAQQVRLTLSADNPVEAMIIAPADPWGLTEIMAEVSAYKVPVFSYDELIMDTDAVSYYVTFDTRKAGQALGNRIIEEEDLEKLQKEEATERIRFWNCSTNTMGLKFLYNGLMETLTPYLDDGVLIESRQAPDVICTLDGEDAVNAVGQLKKRGGSLLDEDWPDIYTVSNDLPVIRLVASGEIRGTYFEDSRTLASVCSELVDTYLSGETPEVSDYGQYDNGLRLVKTVTCEAEFVSGDDYQMLIDSGYFSESEL